MSDEFFFQPKASDISNPSTAFSHIAGSIGAWMRRKREMYFDGLWAEHLSDQRTAIPPLPFK